MSKTTDRRVDLVRLSPRGHWLTIQVVYQIINFSMIHGQIVNEYFTTRLHLVAHGS